MDPPASGRHNQVFMPYFFMDIRRVDKYGISDVP